MRPHLVREERIRRRKNPATPSPTRDNVPGSGTGVGPLVCGVKLTSSSAKEPPPGSPVITMDRIPGNASERSSFGAWPLETKFCAKVDPTDPNDAFAAL